jgi:hypothetical protein
LGRLVIDAVEISVVHGPFRIDFFFFHDEEDALDAVFEDFLGAALECGVRGFDAVVDGGGG